MATGRKRVKAAKVRGLFRELMAGAQAMLAAPPADVVEKMESHGVVQPITVYIER